VNKFNFLLLKNLVIQPDVFLDAFLN